MKMFRSSLITALALFASYAVGEPGAATQGPVFTREPPNRVDFSNSTGAVVECAARAQPQPDIIWMRADGTAVGDVPGLRQVLANGNLVFPPFRAEDYRQDVHAQVYVCLARNSVGSILSKDVNVRAVVAQAYSVNFHEEYVLRGNTAILKCQIPVYKWYKFIDGTTRKQAVALNDRVKQVSGTLIIKEARVEDSGKYLCVVNNSVGGESVETVLTVTAPLKATIEPEVQTIDFGRPAVFTCNFEGNPIKAISWLKDGKKINHQDGILRIESVKKEDRGMYQCFVRNDQESAEATAELRLGGRFEPPQIKYAFPEETKQPGPGIMLKCIASGNPTPEIIWELDAKKLTNSDRLQVGQYVTVNGDVVSHMNITSVHTNDGGLYRCVAGSKVGNAEHAARINVYGPPFIRAMDKQAIVAGEMLVVTCPVAGYPIDSIVWEREGRALPINRKQKVFPNGTLIIENVERSSDQATYTCVARNPQGYTARQTLEVQVMAPPHAPQVNVTATTINSITLKLRPDPSDTAPPHGYTIHYKPEFGEWEKIVLDSPVQKYTLDKLWCGSRYQVYVTAYNTIGTGEKSDNLNIRTEGSKPLIPEATRFIETSSNSITLHLSAWNDGGCPMLYFVVEHKKKTQVEWNQVSNNVKPGGNFIVLDLDPGTWYHLRVTAHNNAGFTVAEYEFATLTITGGTIAPPPRPIPDPSNEDLIKILLSNLNLVVPVVAAVLVIIIAIVVICVLRGKSPHHKDDVVYNQSVNAASTLDKRRPDLRDELGYIAPPNRKLPPVPGSNYNTCDRIKRGQSYRTHATWDPRRHLYEELNGSRRMGSNETMHTHRGMEDEICPYATFHLLGFREEMDPSKAMQFQTFPHPAHSGTMGPSGMGPTPGHQIHSRSGSQSMPRQNGRYGRMPSQGNGSIFSAGPEYDDPANCAPEDDQYGSQYGGYGAPYDHYSSRGSIGRRSVGSARNLPMNGSPEPPPPPPRNHDPNNSSFNDSKDSNEISEAECDRDQMINRNYGETKPPSTTKTDNSQPTILWQCNL